MNVDVLGLFFRLETASRDRFVKPDHQDTLKKCEYLPGQIPVCLTCGL